MDKDISIKVEGLGKEYIINHKRTGDFRSSFNDQLQRLFKGNTTHESFWALKDLNFEIKKGEAVGIIGRNGAGKSTLLKVLSRITEPTIGRFEINGRVSSLLEVGTGFHMELTGRENIFLNGTILGMKRSEIKQKFDEIVDFSGVEKFLDTPVKHYSSGMKVRLAFSVAAHLEPEILIVDEVLAVGDAEFQKKCLGKMNEVSKNDGRTVVFVSHNMGAVLSLCENGILLNKGTIEQSGDIQKIISAYSKGIKSNYNIPLIERSDRKNGLEHKFCKINLLNKEELETNTFFSGESMTIQLCLDGNNLLKEVIVRIQVMDMYGNIYFTCNNYHSQGAFSKIYTENSICCIIDRLPLNIGEYYINLQLMSELNILDELENVIQFKVESGNFFKTGKLPNKGMGMLIDHKWEIQ